MISPRNLKFGMSKYFTHIQIVLSAKVTETKRIFLSPPYCLRIMNKELKDKIISSISQKDQLIEKHTILFNHPEFLKA